VSVDPDVATSGGGLTDGGRSNFVRGADGRVAWLRTHGRPG
jgi:hypothetical protein